MSSISSILESNSEHYKVLLKAGDVANKENISCYLVGGYVRDVLLNRDTTDIDIMIEGLEETVNWYSGISVSQAVDNLLRANPVIADKLKTFEVSSQSLIKAELEACHAEYASGENIRFPVSVWVVSAISSAR